MGLTLKNISHTNSSKEDRLGVRKDYLFEINEFFSRDIITINKQLKSIQKGRFYSELNILFNAGIDLRTALEIYSEEQTKKDVKNLILTIKNSLINGDSLSNALLKTNRFKNYDINSIRIGEETGNLNVVLEELSLYYQREVKQRKQFLSALNYPIIVFITAVAAVGFLLTYLVPTLAGIFQRVNKELPPLTKFIINISEGISHYWILFFLFFFGLILLNYFIRKKTFYRKYTSAIILKIPVVGDLVQKLYLARFSQAMSLLLSSKIPMIKTLQLVKEMIGFYPIEVALMKVEDDIVKGKSLYSSLKQFSVFEKKLVSLIKMAEEVNQLDVIFKRMSIQYSDDVQTRINSINTLIEPILIIFVGVIVSLILIAMYLPMFQIGNSLQ